MIFGPPSRTTLFLSEKGYMLNRMESVYNFLALSFEMKNFSY